MLLLFFPYREHFVWQLIRSHYSSDIFDLCKAETRCNYSVLCIMFSMKQVWATDGCSAKWEGHRRLSAQLYSSQASAAGGTGYYDIMGLNRYQRSIWSEVRLVLCLVKIFFKGRYDILCGEAISRALEAEQKARVQWEQKELHSKHASRKWGLQSRIENHGKGFYRLQI